MAPGPISRYAKGPDAKYFADHFQLTAFVVLLDQRS